MKPNRSTNPALRFEASIALAEIGRFAEATGMALELAGPERMPAAEECANAAAQALLRIARLAEAGDDLESAALALEGALRLRPRYADLHFHYGVILARRGQRAPARRALEAALRENA